MYFQEEIECMPRAELEALQLDRLKWVVAHAYENVPLYKQRFDELGLDPYAIESLDDLRSSFAVHATLSCCFLYVKTHPNSSQRFQQCVHLFFCCAPAGNQSDYRAVFVIRTPGVEEELLFQLGNLCIAAAFGKSE